MVTPYIASPYTMGYSSGTEYYYSSTFSFSYSWYKYNNKWYYGNIDMDTYMPFYIDMVGHSQTGIRVKYSSNNTLLICTASTTGSINTNTSVTLTMICFS